LLVIFTFRGLSLHKRGRAIQLNATAVKVKVQKINKIIKTHQSLAGMVQGIYIGPIPRDTDASHQGPPNNLPTHRNLITHPNSQHQLCTSTGSNYTVKHAVRGMGNRIRRIWALKSLTEV
jgi:hypothetical protein